MDIADRTPLLWRDNSPPTRSVRRSRSRSSESLPYHRQDVRKNKSKVTQSHLELDPIEHVDVSGQNLHDQFCTLTGCPSSTLSPAEAKEVKTPPKSLYGRTTAQLASQRRAYNFTASLNNLILLAQVVLGAALTGLGASGSSHILITVFGATNTIIAGLIAYLKSRGQPMRARMFRDDLERLVDEIENSEVMWRGIAEGAHGYGDIDTDEVTVRSEVARLTRLYERAIRLNGLNNPDSYMANGGFDGSGNTNAARGPRGPGGANAVVSLPAGAVTAVTGPAPVPAVDSATDAVPAAGVVPDEDAAPANAALKKVEPRKDVDKENAENSKEKSTTDKNPDSTPAVRKPSVDVDAQKQPDAPSNSTSGVTANAPTAAPAAPAVSVIATLEDPDASPATAAHLKKKDSRDQTEKDAGSGGRTANSSVKKTSL